MILFETRKWIGEDTNHGQKLVSLPEDYQFSSAKYYFGLDSEFDFIVHYNDFI